MSLKIREVAMPRLQYAVKCPYASVPTGIKDTVIASTSNVAGFTCAGGDFTNGGNHGLFHLKVGMGASNGYDNTASSLIYIPSQAE